MVGVIVGLKLLHVVAGMWLVAGLAGRTLALAAARHSRDIGVVAEVSRLGGRFDRFLVIPGAQAVLITGLLTAWLGGYPLFGFLQGAHANWLLLSFLLYVAITAMVPTIFLPTGKVFDAAMQQAVSAGSVTPSLTAAFHNQRVAWAHRGELRQLARLPEPPARSAPGARAAGGPCERTAGACVPRRARRGFASPLPAPAPAPADRCPRARSRRGT